MRDHSKRTKCVRLAMCLVSVLLGSSASSFSRSLELRELENGAIVFVDWEGREVGTLVTTGQEAAASVVAAMPQNAGWPVVVGEIQSTPAVGDLDADGGFEVVFASISLAVQKLYAFEASGVLHPGWPPEVSIRTGTTPALADIDGDGPMEVFVGAHSLFAFREDGSPVAGWPREGVVGFVTPAIENLEQDGELYVMSADEGAMHVWDTSGQLKPGWPFPFAHQFDRPNSGPAVGDTDGDGVREIGVGLRSIPSIYLFETDGALVPGFPIDLTSGVSGGVSLADVERDGASELWLQSGSGAQIVDGKGDTRSGFPTAAFRGNSPPAIGDLDGDGRLEMVWGTTGGDAQVYAFRDNGTLLPGWPVVVPRFTFNAQATLGDIDGDGGVDIVLGGFTSTFSSSGRIYAWHADGTLIPGFPFSVPEGKAILGSSVTITDLDQDGDVDLVVGAITGFGGTSDGRVFAFDLPAAYNPTTLEWPTLGHDTRHTSRYEPPPRLAAHAGFDREIQCTGPAGEVVTLDGSHSADKDSTPGTNDDIVSFEWFEGVGKAAQALVGNGEVVSIALGLGQHEFTLRVTDSSGSQDTDNVKVNIVDTTPPTFAVHLDQELLWPPNHRMVDVVAQVTELTDACTPAAMELESVGSNEPDDDPGLGDGNTVGDIHVLDNLRFTLRAERDGRGDGRTYTVVYRAEDSSGNSVTEALEVVVPHDLGGSTEPLMLSLSETVSRTTLHWSELGGALSYDVVRGDLKAIKDLNGSYHLGPLTCIAAATSQTSTAGQEDTSQPALGKGFFFLAAYDDGSWSGYGTESAAKDRFVPPGQDGCH